MKHKIVLNEDMVIPGSEIVFEPGDVISVFGPERDSAYKPDFVKSLADNISAEINNLGPNGAGHSFAALLQMCLERSVLENTISASDADAFLNTLVEQI